MASPALHTQYREFRVNAGLRTVERTTSVTAHWEMTTSALRASISRIKSLCLSPCVLRITPFDLIVMTLANLEGDTQAHTHPPRSWRHNAASGGRVDATECCREIAVKIGPYLFRSLNDVLMIVTMSPAMTAAIGLGRFELTSLEQKCWSSQTYHFQHQSSK